MYPPGVWFADVMSSFSGVTFVQFCFGFLVILSLKPRSFVLLFFVLRYACTPTATCSYLTTSYVYFVTTVCVLFRFCFFLFFVSLEMSLFPSIFVPLPFSLYIESTPYVSFLPDGVFYLVTTGWIFGISLCESSISSIRSQTVDPVLL